MRKLQVRSAWVIFALTAAIIQVNAIELATTYTDDFSSAFYAGDGEFDTADWNWQEGCVQLPIFHNFYRPEVSALGELTGYKHYHSKTLMASTSLRLNNLLLVGIGYDIMSGIIAFEYKYLQPQYKRPYCRYLSSKYGQLPPAQSYPLEMFQVSGESNNIIIFYEDGVIEKLHINQGNPGQAITINRLGYDGSTLQGNPINVSTDDGVDFYLTTGESLYKINQNLSNSNPVLIRF